MPNTPCPNKRHRRLLWGRNNHPPSASANRSRFPHKIIPSPERAKRAKPAAKTSANSSIRSPSRAKAKNGTSPSILSEIFETSLQSQAGKMSRLDSSKPSSAVDHPLAAPCPDHGSKNELGSMSMSSTARSDPIVAVVRFQGTPPIGSRGTSLPLGRWDASLGRVPLFCRGSSWARL